MTRDFKPRTDSRWPLPYGFNGILQQPYRYIAGRPMNGHRYTDATWLHPATKSTDLSGHASWYNRLPGWKRSLYFRLPPPYLAVQGGHDLFTWSMRWIADHTPIPAPDFAYHESLFWDVTAQGMLAAPLVAAAAGFKTYRRVQGRNWSREVTGPLANALAALVGQRAALHKSWLTVPRNYLDDGGDPVVVHLPQSFVSTDAAHKRIVDTITSRLGMGDVLATWKMQGSDPKLELTEKPKPPNSVSFAELRDWMELAEEDEPVIGLGVGGSPFRISLKGDSPHIMVTGGSGGGKSVLVKAMVAHFLHHGARIVILDPKGDSHLWAKDLPGVTYAYRTPDIHTALLDLADEQARRIDDGHMGIRPAQRLVVIAEEMNMGIPALRRHWEQVRTKADPKPSPAVAAANNLAFGGRSMLMNCIWVTQSSTAKAYGGSEARENFAVNCMARQSHRQWAMINKGIPMPLPTKHMGRWTVTSAGEPSMVQVIYLTDDEARGWSLSGAPAAAGVATAIARKGWSDVATPDEPTLEFNRLVTLRNIAEQNDIPLKRVRGWAEKDADFPAVVLPAKGRYGAQYDEADVSLYLMSKLGAHR